MSNKRQVSNLREIRYNKSVSMGQIDKFTDIIELISNLQKKGQLPFYMLSTGDLDPEALNTNDKKKHGALFVPIDCLIGEKNRKDNHPLYDKKYNMGRDTTSIQNHKVMQDHARTYMAQYLENGEFVTVELMGVQRQPFNKEAKPEWLNMYVVHGSIVATIPKKLWTFEGLEEVTESVPIEGFVVVNTTNNNRLKLKRQCFKGQDDLQKGIHTNGPSIKKNQYTEKGVEMCGGDGMGYYNASIKMLQDDIKDEVTIAEIGDIKLIAKPTVDAVTFQKAHQFDGEKMMSFFIAQGSGSNYYYTDGPVRINDLEENDVEFQMKFDGESGIIKKDNDGQIHLMVKFQVDVYEIVDGGNLKYRFGWV